uniref:Twinfilin n=1 Tax=Arcella intermedia TaxID=1963864 RepID=A0A6B2L9F2_9EUKA|eukprot:TRINITY_DN25064_c0_g1_i1.p1 TRINITY_DN25064_c0_g1~~TRINITY_DN25064_c0_g1_i1.p1  ORF type:complete len:336 (-),score=48.95 TRINITY_DN25064_c0_g1_i1:4-1011(-)
MSHSSGITVSDGLLSTYSDSSRNSGVRAIKIQIKNEAVLEVIKTIDPVAEWEKDFDLVPTLLDEREAAYVLYRTDLKNDLNNHLWYLLCYVPDKCKVRDKMVYASTRANLKSGIGSVGIVDEIFGTHATDFNSAGFVAWKQHQEADVPLTELEQQKNEEVEAGLFKGGAGTSTAYVHGVAFPVDEPVVTALDALKAGDINYLQVGIDPDNEKIILKDSGTHDISAVPAQFPNNEPRFHFFKWTHENDGEVVNSILYCYSCPSSPVKLRMLYSTSKANVAAVAQDRGVVVDLKLEISNADEFLESDIRAQLHPPKAETKKTFAKPKPAGGRQLIKK